MKRSTLLAVLGLAASVSYSFGQGYIIFNSYLANYPDGAITTYMGSGSPLGGFATAELFYALGTVSDPVYMGSIGSIMSPPSSPFTAIPSSIVYYDSNGDGYFQGGTITIPGYTGGPVSFEIVATGIGNGHNWWGRSGSFTESSIVNSPGVPVTFFGENGPGMPNFVVAWVPEPTTLAVLSLGGLISLAALRRQNDSPLST